MKQERFSKRTIKKILAVGFILSCTLQFSGCGSNKQTDTAAAQKCVNAQSEQEKKAPVYAVNYQDLEIEGVFICSVLSEDIVYVLNSRLKEASGEYEQHIYSLNPEETSLTLFPVTFKENTYVNYMCTNPKGNLLTVQNMVEKNGDKYQSTYWLTGYTQEGTEFLNTEITELSEPGEFLSIQYAATDQEGKIYLSGIKGENNAGMIWIFDEEGKRIGELVCDSWIYAMCTLPNGKAAAAMMDRTGGPVLQEIDAQKKGFGKVYRNLPDADSNFVCVSENAMLMTGDSGAYQYDITTETYAELLNWTDCDMNSDAVYGFGLLHDGRLWAICQEKTGETKMQLAYLSEKTTSETTEKVTIVVGTLEGDQNLSRQVSAFNQTSERYRVEVRNYVDGQDLYAGKLKMDTELISGNGPDIIYLNNNTLNYGVSVNPQIYMLRGILEDLNPYFDADETIQREDYVENALCAYEIEDKLYGIVPFFKVSTVIGSALDVGEEPGWTMEDAMALMESKPEGTEFFAYQSKDWMLYTLCKTYMNRLIDWSSGECKFDDGYFEKILKFADQFPEENFHTSEDEDEAEMIQKGQLLLVPIEFYAVPDYMMYRILFGGPITFIGYPAEEGVGSYITPAAFIGMTAGSEYKEGAWEFMKLFLSEKYQNQDLSLVGFPVLRSALENIFEENMTPVYSEENGEKTEQTKYYWNGLQFGAATRDDVDAVMALIESAHGVTGDNIEVTNIIREEAGAFFEGHKSAKEVADIIQSRVQIYVNENR